MHGWAKESRIKERTSSPEGDKPITRGQRCPNVEEKSTKEAESGMQSRFHQRKYFHFNGASKMKQWK